CPIPAWRALPWRARACRRHWKEVGGATARRASGPDHPASRSPHPFPAILIPPGMPSMQDFGKPEGQESGPAGAGPPVAPAGSRRGALGESNTIRLVENSRSQPPKLNAADRSRAAIADGGSVAQRDGRPSPPGLLAIFGVDPRAECRRNEAQVERAAQEGRRGAARPGQRRHRRGIAISQLGQC
ncbi:MAG: hypothetical protein JWM75_2906, partial [Sphingomonas bacterium]|nr:hypothetical protein [Sphingomonas bacterium]